MYFKATYRHNSKTDKSDWYFRLVESYRNVLDEVRQRTVLSVGFLSDVRQQIIVPNNRTPSFIQKKSVVPRTQILKNEVVENYHFMDG